ncbi:mas-related G-protein coupled receptor member B4-like [Melospiza melodia melodia]|uniref:mas-related G-protein coupled receptor member B4-like n=1 Tax=Melospiza melodia melodia TaxID=1914991 RepID=UPI002FD52288
MEVTTVSPSAASPTARDDLCETDVTRVAIHSVTVVFCLCGLAGNRAVIGLLSLKIGNCHFFYMAFIDFLFLLFAVPSAILILVEDVSCCPIMPFMYMNFIFQLSVVSYYKARISRMTVLYIDKLSWLCCHCHLPERLLWVLDSFRYWAFFALFAVIPSVIFLCPSHEPEHYRAALISLFTLILLLFAASVAISGTNGFMKAKWVSQQQQPKKRDIVILIIVVLALLLTICNFLQQLGYLTRSSQVVFLLACINSPIKPFICFLVGKCRRPCSVQSLRLSLQSVLEETEENTAHSHDPAMDTGV